MDRQQEGLSEATLLAGFGPPQWIPEPYQIRGVDWLLQPEAALFFKPGLGKTATTLAAFKKLKELGFAKRMLVVAPLKVCQTTWPGELRKWAQFIDLKLGVAHGKDKIKIFEDENLDIVLVNYEGLFWVSEHLDKRSANFEVICYDELSKMKNHRSKRFRMFKKHMGKFKFRWGLTGTPLAKGVLWLFGQVYCLDLGKRLGKYVTHFRSKYAYTVPWDAYNYYVTDENSKAIMSRIEDLALFMNKEDWLNLPPLVTVSRTTPMPKKLRAQYSFFEDEYILKLEDTVITAANAGVLTSKLRQFTGGAMYDEQREWEAIHSEKIELLDDLVEELNGEPLIIVYQFDHERERLLKAYPDALVFKGGMSKAQTQHTVTAWNSGAHSIMLVQPASAATGLNLQFGGHSICWYTLTYDLEMFEQMNDRLHRRGQTESVFCYLLTMEGTIDEDVAKVLERKDATQVMLLDTLKK